MSWNLACLFVSHETRSCPDLWAIKIMVSAGSVAHFCYLLDSDKSSQHCDMSQGYRESVLEIYLNIPCVHPHPEAGSGSYQAFLPWSVTFCEDHSDSANIIVRNNGSKLWIMTSQEIKI